MDYQYEQLGDDKFQELCQALLVKEHPDVQCFPIGQPDGGRDMVLYGGWVGQQQQFSVYQVKFVKKPQAEKEPHNWLEKVIEAEAPKIAKLIPTGAQAYYIVTNVQGTAHLDSGAIDGVNAILKKHIKIPSFCWWRDDLNRRMDNAWDLKWAYPELMVGADLIRLVLEKGLTEQQQRRSTAIRAYVTKQSEGEEEVRFKQVDLYNNLIDLFIDVPVESTSGKRGGLLEVTRGPFLYQFGHRGEAGIGDAAALLLHRVFSEGVNTIVLEGGPGQGKSTIVQFVSQMHRMKLLGKAPPDKLDRKYIPQSVRLPIKLDLRDFGAWLQKRDPFTTEDSSKQPDGWQKSLESFIAAHIRYFSGGVTFDVNDVHAIGRVSSILLVLDGLDEVANATQRKDVIAEIRSGVSRLRSTCASLQVIVTSRPPAFSSIEQLPIGDFPRITLGSLGLEHIQKYTEQWIAAYRMKGRDLGFIRRILREKVEQPHIRDLARNPMQLAILLSLIHTHGSSLPDKRTALYDGYVDIFFNREAEKSDTVRDHRTLLVDLHGYLGWVLHSVAETAKQRAGVSKAELEKIIGSYLEAEEVAAPSVLALFTGAVERIFFLVSRLQGMFEFDVQPLREYFAARFLHETAPYSPTGKEKAGTKPDRFDAIAQNPYWLNVTRFYAGFYSKGELPSLVDRIRWLSEQDGYQYTNYPRRLAALLLSDWVFHQDRRSTKAAIDIVLERPTIRRVVSGDQGFHVGRDDVYRLPQGCGREEVAAKCMALLKQPLRNDYIKDVARLLVGNAAAEEIDRFWRLNIENCPESDFSRWLHIGQYTGSLPRTALESLVGLLSKRSVQDGDLAILLNAGHSAYIYSSTHYTRRVIELLLAGLTTVRQRPDSLLTQFALAVNPWSYTYVFHYTGPQSLLEMARRYTGGITIAEFASDTASGALEPAVLSSCQKILDVAIKTMQLPTAEWHTQLNPWNEVTHAIEEIWGLQPVLITFATIAAACRTNPNPVLPPRANGLFNTAFNLVTRARYARLRTGNAGWWSKQIAQAQSDFDRELCLTLFLAWGGPVAIAKLVGTINPLVDQLSVNAWHRVFSAVRFASGHMARAAANLKIQDLGDLVSPRVVVALSLLAGPEQKLQLYSTYLTGYSGDDDYVLSFCEECSVRLACDVKAEWRKALANIRRRYAIADSVVHSVSEAPIATSLTLESTAEILKAASDYPSYLVTAAEVRGEREVHQRARHVLTIATQESWFDRK